MSDSSAGGSTSVGDGPSPASSSSGKLDSRLVYLSLDDRSVNPVEEAGANHFERPSPQLSPLEHFYVNVARIFAEEQLAKQKKAEAAAAAVAATSSSLALGQDKAAILDDLKRARFQLDNIGDVLDSCLGKEKLTLSERTAERHEDRDREDSDKQGGVSEEEKSFRISRRNRLALITHIHTQSFSTAATLLSHAHSRLAITLETNRRLHLALSHLSSYFLIRHRIQPVARVRGGARTDRMGGNIELMADLGLEGLKGRVGRVRLDSEGGVLSVEADVGRISKQERTIRQNRKKRSAVKQQSRPAQDTIMDTGTEEKKDSMEDNITASSSSSPSPDPSSAVSVPSLSSWRYCAIRLQRAQHQLLHQQIHSTIMEEAKDRAVLSTAGAAAALQQQQQQQRSSSSHHASLTSNTSSSVPGSSTSFTTTMFNDVITIQSAVAFPSLFLSFPQGPSHPFLIDTFPPFPPHPRPLPSSTDSSSRPPTSCSNLPPSLSSSLYQACVSILLTQLCRSSPSNRPSVLSLPAANDEDWKEGRIELLGFIVGSCYHRLLVKQVEQVIQSIVGQERRRAHVPGENVCGGRGVRVEYHSSPTLIDRFGAVMLANQRFVCQVTVEGTNLSMISSNAPPFHPWLAMKANDHDRQQDKTDPHNTVDKAREIGVPHTYLQFAHHSAVSNVAELRHFLSTALAHSPE